jgi:predicted AAA+ superfamily ATPase
MERNLYHQIIGHLDKKEHTVITGARQTGKSTLLKQTADYCGKRNVPVVFLNLENKDILVELEQSPLNLLKFLPDTDKKIMVFMDEVQYLSDPSNFFKLIYDEYKDKIKNKKSYKSLGMSNINFWRTTNGNEVDFILHETGKSSCAVEVKYNNEKTNEAKYKKSARIIPK